MGNNTFKPFAIGDRVMSEADGPGTVVKIQMEYAGDKFPVCVAFDNGTEYHFSVTGKYVPSAQDTKFDIRHMTAEEQNQFPKP